VVRIAALLLTTALLFAPAQVPAGDHAPLDRATQPVSTAPAGADRPPATIDPAKRAWFEHAIDDILSGHAASRRTPQH
jgi:hypothetical protein